MLEEDLLEKSFQSTSCPPLHVILHKDLVVMNWVSNFQSCLWDMRGRASEANARRVRFFCRSFYARSLLVHYFIFQSKCFTFCSEDIAVNCQLLLNDSSFLHGLFFVQDHAYPVDQPNLCSFLFGSSVDALQQTDHLSSVLIHKKFQCL